MFRNRVRTYALIGAAAVAGVLAAVIPALGSSDEDAVRLHLGTNGQYFSYQGERQPITEARCGVNAPSTTSPIWVTYADTSDRGAGLNSFGIGVKSGGAQGTPCGRVDATETLVLEMANADSESPLYQKMWHELSLDLELKGNAWIVMDMYAGNAKVATYELVSGSSIPGSNAIPASDTNPEGGYLVPSTTPGRYACGSEEADSAADAGPRDNCRWNIDPSETVNGETTDIVFDRLEFNVLVGEFSLEGGADFGENQTANDSLFYIANAVPVANDDTAYTATNPDPTIKGSPVTIDVLENDYDDDGDPLTIVPSSISDPLNGSVVLNDDPEDVPPTITYTPDAGFVGTDSFTYQVTDGSATSSAATVTVRVDPTMDCVEPLTLDPNDDRVTAVYRRVNIGGCPEKPVVLELTTTKKPQGEGTVDLPTVLFQPRPLDGSPAVSDCSQTPADCADEFFGELSFTPRDKANAPDTLTLEYDPVVRESADDAVLRAMPWCLFDPNDADELSTEQNPVEMRDALPVGDSWCIYEVSVTIQNETENRTTWYVYGIGDPFKRAS